MKAIVVIGKILRWIIGVILCLSAIGSLSNGQILLAIFLLLLGLLSIPPVTKALFKKKIEEDRPKLADSHNSSNEGKISAEAFQPAAGHFANNSEYIADLVQRQGIQLLESLSLLGSTKNLDTLVGRYDFILDMYSNFVSWSHHPRYSSDIQVAIDEFKSMYYDRLITGVELALLLEPNFEQLRKYFTLCVLNCFDRFYQEQMEQISKLKKETAKQRRRTKIIEIGRLSLSELYQRGDNDISFKDRVESLEKLLETLEAEGTKLLIGVKRESISVETPFIINKGKPFELTLYGAEYSHINSVIAILNDENIWNKVPKLFPLFSAHDIKCKEVEEYILTYKPLYEEKLQGKILASSEYQTASLKDKEEIEKELKLAATDELPERADCDLVTLFDYSDFDTSIDNDLVNKYGYEVISKYFGLSKYKDKIATHWERKDFEDLIKADLVYTADEIPQEEILLSQPLKVLNLICEKEEGYFKRKNKAIEYLKENEHLRENIGKHIITRNLFKIKPLPKQFDAVNTDDIEKYWTFLGEYIKLIADTYRNSEWCFDFSQNENTWAKSIKIEKREDYNSNFVCARAKEECKKEYPVSQPPNVPFHIGCNCHLKYEH